MSEGLMVAAFAVAAGSRGEAPHDPAQVALAREHYMKGVDAYDNGRYDEAIAEFQQAYEIKDDAVLLYNIAQSKRLEGHYDEALMYYKVYLRRAPKAPNRDEVEQRIADMADLIAKSER